MNKGSVVIKWAEPQAWNRVLLRIAKKNPTPKSWTRFVPFIFAFTVISGALIWDWLKDDREGFVSTVATVVAAALVFSGLYLFHYAKIKWFPARVWIRENGIEMGDPLGRREWDGFSEIEGFFFDSDMIDGESFRFLYWLPEGAQYPNSAVIPPEVDEYQLRAFLVSKGLEELDFQDA